MLEGFPQRYGTQLEIGLDGEPVPHPIEMPDEVDELRAAVGLGPIAESVAKAERRPPRDAAQHASWQRETEVWSHQVRWRS